MLNPRYIDMMANQSQTKIESITHNNHAMKTPSKLCYLAVTMVFAMVCEDHVTEQMPVTRITGYITTILG